MSQLNIKDLPWELQEYVLLQLSYPDVIRLRGINTTFREIIDGDSFWKLKTRRDFGVESSGELERSILESRKITRKRFIPGN